MMTDEAKPFGWWANQVPSSCSKCGEEAEEVPREGHVLSGYWSLEQHGQTLVACATCKEDVPQEDDEGPELVDEDDEENEDLDELAAALKKAGWIVREYEPWAQTLEATDTDGGVFEIGVTRL